MDNFAPTAEALYPAYKLAENALLALDEKETKSEQGKRICSEYLKIAEAYASTLFGQVKLYKLRLKLYDTQRAKMEEDALKNGESFNKKEFIEFWDNEDNISIIVSDAMALGKSNLNREWGLDERDKERFSIASAIHAPKKIKATLEKQGLNVGDFFNALRIQVALGGEVPAVDGSQFYRLYTTEGKYEDYREYTIGYYSTKEAAHIALAELIFFESEGASTVTPWGFIDDFDDPAPWNAVRLQWFQSATFQEMINWYTSFEHKGEEREFYLTEQSVSPRPPLPFAPKGLMEAKLGAR